MQQLKVVGIEDGALVLATESGDRFTLPVDDTLRAQLRRTQKSPTPAGVRPNPKEIQTRIRAGLSSAEVAELLGVRIDDVERFAGPVIAEREHVVSQALAMPVLGGLGLEDESQPTFGTAIRHKLAELGANAERWTSWRDQDGWTVKLEFTANEIDHDARWSFDPRRSVLSPLNTDATQLSRQGALPEGLIPRLRALDSEGAKDASRFDSGAFGPRRLPEPEADMAAPEVRTPVSPAVEEAAIKRAPEPPVASADTADLLDALRRRRGLREPMPEAAEDEPAKAAPTAATAPIALFDALEPGYSDEEEAPGGDDDHSAPQPSASDASRRKGRTSMPSWDEIVFGARGDD